MRRSVAASSPISGLTAALFTVFGSSAEAAILYKCMVNQVLEVDPVGQLVSTDFTKLAEGKEFVFDAATGTFRQDSIDWQFDVVSPGSESNSLKAVRILDGPAATVLQTLVIRTWKNGEFIFAWDNEVRSGVCRAALYEEQN